MWDEPRAARRDVSPEAFMEELCAAEGGYGRFFWRLFLHYLGWWAAVVIVPALFLDHHRCEANMPYYAWLLYAAVIVAMLAVAVLLELSVVQRLGLLKAEDLQTIWSERRWRLPLITTVLWKLDSYTDVVFIFIARDCGSSLWWASLATFVFGVVFGQLFFNSCFAITDCDHELPASFGFVLLDFKLVNTAVQNVLPFDPDASHLPVSRPVTLRTIGHLIGLEKVVGDIAQVSIQGLFLYSTEMPHHFVGFSVLVGVLHGTFSLFKVVRECVQDEWAVQTRTLRLDKAMLQGAQLTTVSSNVLDGVADAPDSLRNSPSGKMSTNGGGSPSSGGGGIQVSPKVPPKPAVIGRPQEKVAQEIPDLL